PTLPASLPSSKMSRSASSAPTPTTAIGPSTRSWACSPSATTSVAAMSTMGRVTDDVPNSARQPLYPSRTKRTQNNAKPQLSQRTRLRTVLGPLVRVVEERLWARFPRLRDDITALASENVHLLREGRLPRNLAPDFGGFLAMGSNVYEESRSPRPSRR